MNAHTRLLVVDDDPDLRQLLKTYFEAKDGYEVLEAEDAKTGLASAASGRPQLIVADLAMPRMSGLDFIAAVRRDPDLKHIPIVVCTARQSTVDALHCLRIGANAFFPKPMDMAAFRLKIKELLGHPA
jgi:twitching motility two-component system response regulator PilH